MRALARHPWRTLFALIALALVALVLLWDWNWFKGPIERRVQANTGRSFDIGGDLDVDLGWTPTISAERLRFGNASWSKEPTMAATDRLEFRIELRPLLFERKVLVPEVVLDRPTLHLERGPGGVGNWVFGEPGGMQPQFRRVLVEDGKLRFLDPKGRTDISLAVDSAPAGKDDAAPPIVAEGGGRWHGNRFTIRGRADSPLALRDRQRPYRIDAHAAAGATRAHARGTLLDPLRMRDFDLQLALSGQDMADLFPLIGIATPPTPPYKLDGRFTRDGRTWHYDRFKGVFGDSDLSGSASVTTGGKRPFLRATLASRRLDIDDLAGFIGAAPQAGRGETTNPELQRQAARDAARARLLPDRPYELDKLRAMDADVRWKATHIETRRLPIDDMDARLRLDAGVAHLDPLDFGVAGGDVRADIRLDARQSTIRTRAKVNARRLDLPRLLPTFKAAGDVVGKVGGDIALAGSGNSIAAMLATADGTAALGMGRGQVSNLLMEWAGLDIAEALKFMIKGDRKVPVRCAFGDFAVDGGVMQARSLAFDTTDTIIIGEGRVDLRNETLDLKLRPRPKDRSLFVFRAPLLVGGTFKDPSFRPDFKRVGLRGAIALALGNIAPPAALLATIELGPGRDSDCGGRYAR